MTRASKSIMQNFKCDEPEYVITDGQDHSVCMSSGKEIDEQQ